MVKAGITGVLMALALFVSHELGYGGEFEPEFTRRRELPMMPVDERIALNRFLRVTGHAGIPEECVVSLDLGGDPEDPRDWQMNCHDTIRIDR